MDVDARLRGAAHGNDTAIQIVPISIIFCAVCDNLIDTHRCVQVLIVCRCLVDCVAIAVKMTESA